MDSLTRRTALRLAAGAAAVGLAGCSDGGSGGGGVGSDGGLTLGELAVTHFDSESYTIHLSLLDGDSPVFWQSKPVPAAEDGDPGEVVFENYPTDLENEVLHARLEGQPRSEWERFEFGEFDAACLGLQFRIGTFTGDGEGDLSIWTSDNPRECEDE